MTTNFGDLPANIQNDILTYASPWKNTYKQVIKEFNDIHHILHLLRNSTLGGREQAREAFNNRDFDYFFNKERHEHN